MPEFDTATALTRTDDPGHYHVRIDPHWQAAGRTNGGYLLALLGRAALTTVGDTHPHPVSATAHFLRPPVPAPAEVQVDVLRTGRTTAHVRAVLRQSGHTCVEAVLTCGQLDGDVWWDGVAAPELPAEGACPRLPVQAPGFEVPLMGVLAERLDPATLGWVAGRPSGRGELRGWVRFADGRDMDPLALLALVDCLPPATFDLGIEGWVPTIELTCYLRALPMPGPVRIRQRVRHVAAGRVDEVCDIWDASGRRVASGHQLAGVRLPAVRTPAHVSRDQRTGDLSGKSGQIAELADA